MENELAINAGLKYEATVLHPLVLCLIIIACVFIFRVQRRYMIVYFIFLTLLIPMEQRIAVLGLNLYVLRILILLVWIRLIVSSEYKSIKLNKIDQSMIIFVIFSVMSYCFLWQTWGAFINRLGFAFNILGLYFLFRSYFVDFEDINFVINLLAVVSVIIAACMVIEQITGRNDFYIFGGVNEFIDFRKGRLRSQAAFATSITAGTFGATMMPLFLSLWRKKSNSKKIVLIGIFSSLIITISSFSSGPVITFISGVAAISMWHFRKHMRIFRWGIVILLVGLQIVMKAPVWALINRVGIVGGSSAWHRYYLLDNFINRFHEWWLIGTKDTSHWGYHMNDVVNQYVSIGVYGGIFTLIFFIIIIKRCFSVVGIKMRKMEKQSEIQFHLWCIGSSLFANVVAFFGITYFDQIMVIWYMLLAMISSIDRISYKSFYS